MEEFVEVHFTNYLINHEAYSAEGWIFTAENVPNKAEIEIFKSGPIRHLATQVMLGDSFRLKDDLRPRIKFKTAFYFFGSFGLFPLQSINLKIYTKDNLVHQVKLPKQILQLNLFLWQKEIKQSVKNIFSMLWIKQQIKKYLSNKIEIKPKVRVNKLTDISAFAQINLNIPLSLIIDHNLGGGANYFRDEQIQNRLLKGEQVVLLTYDLHTLNYQLTYSVLGKANSIMSFKEFSTLSRFLEENKFSEIYFNCLVSFPTPQKILGEISAYCENKPTKLVIAIHDFFMLCPSYNLLNNIGQFCHLPEETTCSKCIPNLQAPLTNLALVNHINEWREWWLTLFKFNAEIHCFSHSSKELFLKCYPLLASAVKVIPHQLPQLRKVKPSTVKDSKMVHIGIVGGISYSKGDAIVRAIANHILKEQLPVKIIVIGNIKCEIATDILVQTGPYKVAQLPELMEQYEIDLVFMPSIWPETFSYVCHEIKAIDMPLVTFNLGAQHELALKYDKGYSLSISEPQIILKQLLDIYQLHLQKS